MTVCY